MSTLIARKSAEQQKEKPVNDPIGTAARAAAQRLEEENSLGLAAEVEAALAARDPALPPPQYLDPVSLASLIVSIAGLAWTVYTDLRKRTSHPWSWPGPSGSGCATATRVRPIV
jgi:hypothetical protein